MSLTPSEQGFQYCPYEYPLWGIENPLNLPKGRLEESVKMKRRLNV
jgi:hypothetical protein